MCSNTLKTNDIALALSALGSVKSSRACVRMGKYAICSISESNILLNLMSVEI